MAEPSSTSAAGPGHVAWLRWCFVADCPLHTYRDYSTSDHPQTREEIDAQEAATNA